MGSGSRAAPRLYAITDRRAAAGDLVSAVEAAVGAGLRWIQVREKDLPAGELLDLVGALVAVARPAGARVLVNDRADVALAAGADGVHLTERSLPAAAVRRAFPSLLVGASVHGVERAVAEAAGGADFLLVGPVFATPSKIAFGPPLELAGLSTIVRAVTVPVVAVGGIGPGEVRACLDAGAHGVAAIRGLLAHEDPAAAARAYLAEMGDAAALPAHHRR